jgi:hypothetical protein
MRNFYGNIRDDVKFHTGSYECVMERFRPLGSWELREMKRVVERHFYSRCTSSRSPIVVASVSQEKFRKKHKFLDYVIRVIVQPKCAQG